MTTSQPAHGVRGPVEPGSVVPGPVVPESVVPAPAGAPDRETLARVLDGLRELDPPERPAADPTSGPAGIPPGAPAVPLPRRRSERRAPSVD